MAPVGRPENVLKRAEELIAVDQSAAALELLYDTITSKRTRNISQVALEPIILRFVELAVSLRKSKIVKDGLHQYKKIVQTSNIGSIETVVQRFVELSESKVQEAQEQADKITLDVDEDLEAAESPEDILLATVSSEQTKDRTDREVVTPWLKFLWEAYRSTLDILRNNSRLELLYQQVVQQAFDFCVKYTRKTEFRRLCELLRNHLQSAAGQLKNSGLPNPIDLSDPETLQRYLDTRFAQLNVAVKLELWQEAFRSVEDVHTLLTVSKRPAKSVMMANYYDNLARIFLVSDNHLFHAAAWSRYYSLILQVRSVPEAELTRIASFLLLSTLSIPTSSSSGRSGVWEEDQRHRNTRLTGLLNLTKNPSREGLLKSALNKNVLAHVRPEIRDLYKILEVDFHPLSIKARISPIVNKIAQDSEYAPYFRPLYQVILSRLFQQLSQVYDEVRLDFVIELATFPTPFDVSPAEIERFIVKGCHRGEFAIGIDHNSRSITFKHDLFDENKISQTSTSGLGNAVLQATPADIVRTQLSRMGKLLLAAVSTIDPVFAETQLASRTRVVERAAAGLERENRSILARRETIETRQRDAEAEQLKREDDDAKRKALLLQQEQQAEKERQAEDARKRELERIKREQDAIREEEKKKIAEEINSKGIIKIDVNHLEDLDTNRLRIMQLEQLAKENKDLNERLRIIGRKLDHTERAYRYEEIDLWNKDAESQQAVDVKLYEARKEALLIKSKQDFEHRLALKGRLQRLVPDYEKLRKVVESRRKHEFEKRRHENEKALQEEKANRIKEVRARREQEEQQALEEERRAQKEQEEAERREEEKRIADEERAEQFRQEKKERDEQRSQMEEAARKQAEKELEIERRLEERKAQRSGFGSREPHVREPLREPTREPLREPVRSQAPSSGAYRVGALGGRRPPVSSTAPNASTPSPVPSPDSPKPLTSGAASSRPKYVPPSKRQQQ